MSSGSTLTEWHIVAANAATLRADVLVCPANVFLTLSGGVGGELLLQYGDAMQGELRSWLAERGLRFVRQGDIIETSGGGSPYRAVLHAIAVDGFYQSSRDVVGRLISQCLDRANELGAASVVLPALATGYGRLPIQDFARSLLPMVDRTYTSIRRVTICVRRAGDIEIVRGTIPDLKTLGAS